MKTVIELAREAGMVYREFEDEFANANTDGVDVETLERFAELVRADERAKLAEQPAQQIEALVRADAIAAIEGLERSGIWITREEAIAAIQNRSNT